MTKQRIHTIEVTDRELGAIIAAFDIARDDLINSRSAAAWWRETAYIDRLYTRLRGRGLGHDRART